MIAGTDFVLTDFQAEWPDWRDRAGRWATPEAVEQAAGSGFACLRNPEGMLVFTLKPDDNGRWTAFMHFGVSTGSRGAFARNEPALLAIARDMGASTLAFRTDRRGWARLLGPEWRRSGDRYERGL